MDRGCDQDCCGQKRAHWRYVDAILRSWKEKGRDGTDRKTAEEDRKRDSEGKYADFINY